MSDEELDRLRKNHEQLRRQVKTLLVSEQQLFRTKRALERQMQQIERLGRFSLQAAQATSDGEILTLAAELLLDVFPYDRSAFFDASEDAVHVSALALRVSSGGSDPRGGTVAPWSRPMPSDVEVARGCGRAPDARFPNLCAASAPGSPRECSGGFHLAVPVADGGETRLLTASRCDAHYSHVEALATDDDLPFLRLLGRHLESALATANLRDRMQAVLDRLPHAVLAIADGRVRYANGAASRLLGHRDGSALVGLAMSELRVVEPSDDPGGAGDTRRTLEARLLRADGTSVAVDLVEVAFRYDDRPATLVVAEDLTERATMRTQLLQADRLATVGSLAAGVAHEINNPLTYVIMSLERVARDLRGQPTEKHVRIALDGAERIRTIVTDLKTFGRMDADRRAPVDVEAVLDRVLTMASYELRYRTRVVRDFRAERRVVCNEGRLAQAFLNLVVNSAHAMDEDRAETNELRVSTREDGSDVVVTIDDTGHGIPPEVLPRIFDPFFTTKPQGVGSGLGLAICKGIIESVGGTIGVESRPGRGTRFFVRLPAATARVSSLPPATSRERQRPTRRRRLLVVDDEPRVAEVVAERLREHGDVSVATSGREAIEMLSTTEFDAAFVDLMMPDVSGMDVEAWAAQHRPMLRERMVFVTGGAFTPRGRLFLERIRNPVLEKPVSDATLAEALDRVFGEGNPALPPDAED